MSAKSKGKGKQPRSGAYNPAQTSERRSKIRRIVRDIEESLDNSSSDAKSTLVKVQAAHAANYLETPSLVAADARILRKVADVKLKDMIGHSKGVVPWGDAFTFQMKLVSHLHNNEDSSDVAPKHGRCWNQLGKIALQHFRTPVSPSFMLGPLGIEKIQKIRKVAQRQKREVGPAVKPSEGLDEDAQADGERTTREAQQVVKIVQGIEKKKKERNPDDDTGVCMFELCVNPKSFSQTVENFFHLAFVVKSGFIEVSKTEGAVTTSTAISLNEHRTLFLCCETVTLQHPAQYFTLTWI
eukprot:m.277761 g.277761  ORF g.277761 m.277761 type:complete len:297 (+) comp19789_c0_seq4:212-1102(+)